MLLWAFSKLFLKEVYQSFNRWETWSFSFCSWEICFAVSGQSAKRILLFARKINSGSVLLLRCSLSWAYLGLHKYFLFFNLFIGPHLTHKYLLIFQLINSLQVSVRNKNWSIICFVENFLIYFWKFPGIYHVLCHLFWNNSNQKDLELAERKYVPQFKQEQQKTPTGNKNKWKYIHFKIFQVFTHLKVTLAPNFFFVHFIHSETLKKYLRLFSI